jgi:hypothetical protein
LAHLIGPDFAPVLEANDVGGGRHQGQKH